MTGVHNPHLIYDRGLDSSYTWPKEIIDQLLRKQAEEEEARHRELMATWRPQESTPDYVDISSDTSYSSC